MVSEPDVEHLTDVERKVHPMPRREKSTYHRCTLIHLQTTARQTRLTAAAILHCICILPGGPKTSLTRRRIETGCCTRDLASRICTLRRYLVPSKSSDHKIALTEAHDLGS